MTKGLQVRLCHRTELNWANSNVDAWGEISSLGVRLPEFQGKGVGTIGIIHDISERLKEEQRIQKELDSRNIILKEIHHHIKNNLQIVSSLLSLESSRVQDEKAKEVFGDCQSHIHSMSLVHEQIYRTGDLGGVNAPAYFERLATYLAGSNDAYHRGISLKTNIENIVLSLDSSIPLSIIATELVSNSFKHAFSKKSHGNIDINLSKLGNNYVFSVKDNGNSDDLLSKNDSPEYNQKGIGMDLITALVDQLKGKLEFNIDHGTETKIIFPA